ncbi:MAG: proton-conducting transporter membrane subunit [Candidatus Omnitrophica bacterium]|nr:proton-conducting transporter membrane subunit [Candidatus Omnitrophota bacterium]MDD5574697.1 proton-conducting transporter membrane subunit [Candidatus Omnitrophota bacterium]
MATLLILLPLAIIMVLNLPFKDAFKRAAPFLGGCFYLLQAALVVFHPAAFWDDIYNPLEAFFAFECSTDALSLVLFLSIAIVGFVAVLVGAHALKNPRQRFFLINLLLLATVGMNANVMVTDLFSTYVFLEVTAVASFILIAMMKGEGALEGAFKYIILSVIASVMMLLSLALLVLVTGQTSFEAVRAGLGASPESLFVKMAMILFVCGLFVKGGVVPFHAWVPDVYASAPSFVSVFLAGIVTKVSGVYILMRLLVSVFGFEASVQQVIMFVGALSIVVGALAALAQRDFKRMLAYSSISQVGYIVLALGCGTPLAVAGAAFHLFNHAVFKSLLFVNAQGVEERCGTTHMEMVSGLGSRMPVTGWTSVIALLSTAGVPPLAGFWSKLLIIMALLNASRYGYAAVALFSSVLTLAYFLSMQRRMFFGKPHKGMENIREAGPVIVGVEIILAGITVGAGLLYPLVLEYFILPVQRVVG